MKADAYLPVWVEDLPADFAFQPDGKLRQRVAEAVSNGVVKVVAGPLRCHVRVDVRRPYWRPENSPGAPLPALPVAAHA
jgi:hypothetical protein